MASIMRQLKRYGFLCFSRIDEKGVFCHPNFIRDEYELARSIRRKKSWPTKRKRKQKRKVNASLQTARNATNTTISGAQAPSTFPADVAIPMVQAAMEHGEGMHAAVHDNRSKNSVLI
jgi:hypothetical protein